MSERNGRVNELDPTEFFNKIQAFVKENHEELSEVYIRRIISSLFLALFNFWACKRKYIDKRTGRKSNQDYYPFSMFFEELLQKGFDAQIIALYKFRTAADHYIENPTIIEVQGETLVNQLGKKVKVTLNRDNLEKSIEAAQDILKFLRSSANLE
ncbi:hypothetical protein [Thermococcus sp.]